MFGAIFTVTVGATTSCTASLEIAPFTLEFNTYDPDFSTARSSFIAGSENQNIQFKLIVTEGSDQDTITQMNMLSLEESLDSRELLSEGLVTYYDHDSCPDVTELCFTILSNEIVTGLVDDSVTMEDITFTALEEVIYAKGKKRMRNNLMEIGEVSTEATIVRTDNPEQVMTDEILVEESSSIFQISLINFVFLKDRFFQYKYLFDNESLLYSFPTLIHIEQIHH